MAMPQTQIWSSSNNMVFYAQSTIAVISGQIKFEAERYLHKYW